MQKLNQEKLFFILAPDRSGTSILQEIMNTFDNFCNKEESRIAGGGTPSCWEYVSRLNDFSYLEKFIEENWTSEFFIEKSPPSISCLPQIIKKYPNANFIFLKRNPIKILLSQLNLFYGFSELGTRVNDLEELISNQDSALFTMERTMAKRLLNMISQQVRYKKYFKNSIEIKYEDLTDSLDKQLKLLQNKFNIKPDSRKAQDQMKKPSYSSTFRYGIKEIDDDLSKSIIKLCDRLWGYNSI